MENHVTDGIEFAFWPRWRSLPTYLSGTCDNLNVFSFKRTIRNLHGIRDWPQVDAGFE
jgi:hypothetical protein